MSPPPTLPRPATAQGFETTVVEARDAFRRHDRVRLAALKAQATTERNPLALWVDYWELSNRINEVQAPEFAAFAQRWNGTYVEDRLRNDWLLELVRRSAIRPDLRAGVPALSHERRPRSDVLRARQRPALRPRTSARPGLAAWLAQKDADDGCAFLAATLVDAKQLAPADIWRKAAPASKPASWRAARQAVGLISERPPRRWPRSSTARRAISPGRQARRRAATPSSRRWRWRASLPATANRRQACSPIAGSARCRRISRRTPGRASRARPRSSSARGVRPVPARPPRPRQGRPRDRNSPDDTLAWKVRAGLRADNGRARWQQVVQAINAMSPAEQKDAAWIYWKARGLQALARDSQDGELLLATSRELLAGIALADEFRRRARRRGPRPAAIAAAAPGAAHPRRARRRGIGSGLRSRADAGRDRPAQRRRARVELRDSRPRRPRAARGGAACLRARGLGSMHQHQRQDACRGRRGAALPDAAAQGGRRSREGDRSRPGVRLRPDPRGVALPSSTRPRASARPASCS